MVIAKIIQIIGFTAVKKCISVLLTVDHIPSPMIIMIVPTAGPMYDFGLPELNETTSIIAPVKAMIGPDILSKVYPAVERADGLTMLTPTNKITSEPMNISVDFNVDVIVLSPYLLFLLFLLLPLLFFLELFLFLRRLLAMFSPSSLTLLASTGHVPYYEED